MQQQIQTTLTPEQLRQEIAQAVRQSLASMPQQAPSPPPDPPLDTNQACELLHLAKPTLYRHVQQNSIPYHRRGKKLLFFESELTQWIKKSNKKSH